MYNNNTIALLKYKQENNTQNSIGCPSKIEWLPTWSQTSLLVNLILTECPVNVALDQN